MYTHASFIPDRSWFLACITLWFASSGEQDQGQIQRDRMYPVSTRITVTWNDDSTDTFSTGTTGRRPTYPPGVRTSANNPLLGLTLVKDGPLVSIEIQQSVVATMPSNPAFSGHLANNGAIIRTPAPADRRPAPVLPTREPVVQNPERTRPRHRRAYDQVSDEQWILTLIEDIDYHPNGPGPLRLAQQANNIWI